MITVEDLSDPNGSTVKTFYVHRILGVNGQQVDDCLDERFAVSDLVTISREDNREGEGEEEEKKHVEERVGVQLGPVGKKSASASASASASDASAAYDVGRPGLLRAGKQRRRHAPGSSSSGA